MHRGLWNEKHDFFAGVNLGFNVLKQFKHHIFFCFVFLLRIYRNLMC